MERRDPAEAVAANVREMIAASGRTVHDVAQATHVDLSKFEGSVELTFGDLVDVGGLLRVSPAVFFEGVAA